MHLSRAGELAHAFPFAKKKGTQYIFIHVIPRH